MFFHARKVVSTSFFCKRQGAWLHGHVRVSQNWAGQREQTHTQTHAYRHTETHTDIHRHIHTHARTQTPTVTSSSSSVIFRRCPVSGSSMVVSIRDTFQNALCPVTADAQRGSRRGGHVQKPAKEQEISRRRRKCTSESPCTNTRMQRKTLARETYLCSQPQRWRQCRKREAFSAACKALTTKEFSKPANAREGSRA